ncbi:MAG: ABC transporter permease, partial [Bacteroidales bacterium]|nr:ABC transporter permease [Bacteroidales bacterium]
MKKNKSRSFLTILSIFAGVATIFIFISFGLGLYGYINSLLEGGSADKVLVMAKGSAGIPGLDGTFSLGDKDVRAVEKSAGVYEATGVYMKVGLVESRDVQKYVYLMGYDPDVPILMDIGDVDIIEGRELRGDDTGKVTLGYNYMIDDKIFPKGLEVNDKIEVQGKDMRIVGFYESVGNPGDDANVYVVNDAVDEIYPEENNTFGWIVARVDVDEIDRAIENVEKNLRDVRDVDRGKEDFTVESFTDLIESFAGALNII